MRRVTVIKETWSNVMNSQRREDIGKWCQENAISGYQTIKTLVKTLLGKLRLILDASVLRHALANSEYLRLFGVSLVFAIGTSWMVGGAVQMVNNKRRKNRQSTNTGGAMARKKQTNSSKKINLPVNKLKTITTDNDELNTAFVGNKFRPPHPAVIVLSGIVAVAFVAARCVTRSQKKPTARGAMNN
ncbi:hypothetical protein Ndes2526B_g00714 [Nannochloris sp. 'desiccata']